VSQQLQILTDFTQGELSPKMMGRFDLQSFYKGAREVKNFVPFFPGGVTYRPGFLDTGAFKGTGRVRLHPFILSQDVWYILEFGPSYVRYWKYNTTLGAVWLAIESATPYGAGDLASLQFAQSEATLYIASNVAAPRILQMTAIDTFNFGTMTFTGISGSVPFQSPGNYPGTIAIHDGRMWFAATDLNPQGIWGSKPFDYGNFTYYDTISSTSKQYLEPYNEFTGTTAAGSITVTGISAEEISGIPIGHRINGTGIVSKESVTFVGATTIASAVISGVSSSVIAQLSTGETIGGQSIPICTIVSLGTNSIEISAAATATSATNTFTRAERRTYVIAKGASTIDLSIPATAAGTVTLVDGWVDPTVPEYHDVTQTRDVVTSASAMYKTIASDQNERILWMCAGRDLIIGTTCGERVIPSGINAITFTCRRQTAIGSAKVQPYMLNEAIIFVESSGRGAREYLYTYAEDAYQSPNLTSLADHILAGVVRESDYANAPIPIAYFTLEDGTVAGCSYSRIYQLNAWFRIEHSAGTIESLAVVPGASGDVVYAAVNRGGVRRLERMGQFFGTEGHLDSSALAVKAAGEIDDIDWITGDAMVEYEGDAYEVTIALGNAILPPMIPDGATVRVGLPYTGRIKTMPVNAMARIGNAQMRDKTIAAVNCRMMASYPFYAGYDGGTMERAEFAGPLTGDYKIPIHGIWDTEGCLVIEQTEPFDVTVLAIAPEIDAGG